MLAQQQASDAREPKSHFTLATQPEKESEVSDVKASRNIGHSEGYSHRGQRRLCTRRHAPGHPDLDLAQPYPVGREADWSSGAARRDCESAEPRSKPLISNARNQVSGDGYGTTGDPTFG